MTPRARMGVILIIQFATGMAWIVVPSHWLVVLLWFAGVLVSDWLLIRRWVFKK